MFDCHLYAAAIVACTNAVDFVQAKQLHEQIIAERIEISTSLYCALIFMYGKCSEISKAVSLFETAIKIHKHRQDVHVWTALVSAYGQNGEGNSAITTFDKLQKYSLKPDGVFFVALLDACNHAGMPDKAIEIMSDMESQYGIKPSAKHISCVIDGLGRKGRLLEAKKLADDVDISEQWIPLMSLLSCSRLHGDITMAEYAFFALKIMNPKSAAICILLLNCT